MGHTPPSETLLSWPLEIRAAEGQGFGAFAVRDLHAKELLLEEEPFYIRMPPQQLQGRKEWDKAWALAFNGIRKMLVAPKDSSFKEMPEKPLLVPRPLSKGLLNSFQKAFQRLLNGIGHSFKAV